METVCTDDSIKRILIKRQIRTVANEKFCIGKILCLSDTDHFRSEFEADIVFIRVFPV